MADAVLEILDKKYLTRPISYEGLLRKEPLEYPEKALRKAVLNSIIHKKYEGATIFLSVYDDRLTIWNPGGLPTVGFWSCRSALSEKELDYKMLSDSRETVALLDSMDNSYKRSTDFVQHLWDFPEYREDFSRLTKSIKAPVLVITGQKDYAIGVDHYRAFHFPKQQVVSIHGGHVLYYEQNKEFTKAIFSFIKKLKKL